MNESPNGQTDNQQNNKPFLPGGLWYILLAGVGLLGVLYWLSRAFLVTTDQYTFLVLGGANILIFLAILVQALIYRRQWDAMTAALGIERTKTDPRLRVAEVVAESFEVGKRPFYIVTIANDGLLAAMNVRIHMSIEIGNEKPMDWIHDQVVTIPANGREHYFIHSSSWLGQEQFDSFEKAGIPLRVVGFFEYPPKRITNFCYKYVPLQGEYRPPKVPQFVPCDFTPRLNTTLRIQGAKMEVTGFAPTMIHGKAVPEDSNQITPSGEVTNVIIRGNPPNEPQASAEKKEEREEEGDKTD